MAGKILHYDEVRGDVLGLPHMHLTHAAMEINKKRTYIGRKDITKMGIYTRLGFMESVHEL